MRSRGAGRAKNKNNDYGASDDVSVRDCGDRGFLAVLNGCSEGEIRAIRDG